MGDGDEVSHWCHRASRARLNIRPDSRFAFLARSTLREWQRPQRHGRAVRALRLLKLLGPTPAGHAGLKV
jgi:hypothetical protein